MRFILWAHFHGDCEKRSGYYILVRQFGVKTGLKVESHEWEGTHD